MRTLLCYGDSNTWGFDPATQRRFPRDVRWHGRLQSRLGEEWYVVEEGLNGRTTTLESPVAPARMASTTSSPVSTRTRRWMRSSSSSAPMTLADRYGLTATNIARAAARLATVVARSEAGADGAAPLSILACPPPLGETEWAEDWAGAPAKIGRARRPVRGRCRRARLPLIDLGRATRYSALDGIHLDANGHAGVAELVELRRKGLFP